MTENFGVVSCVGANQDVCPAMKGMLSHFYTIPVPGGPVLNRGMADTRFFGGNRGYFPIRSTTLQDFRCHGGCRETWEFVWPHACGRLFQTCAGRRPSGWVCGTGSCPQGLRCGTLGSFCGCS